MNDDLSGGYRITVGILCFLAFAVLFAALGIAMIKLPGSEIRLPLLVITGVMGLFATLALVAVTFSVAGLSDPSQALGLPEGSVRAAIALSLIVIFATMIFVHSARLSTPRASTQVANAAQTTPQPLDDYEKQVISIVGTLMTSVVSFYFAARTSSAAPTATKSAPVLASVSPAQVTKEAAAKMVPVQITGTDLQLASSVKLQKDREIILASSVVSNEQLVKCDVTIDPTTSAGKYDVVVTTSDDQTASLIAAFEVVAG
jgi:hypothetical protein